MKTALKTWASTLAITSVVACSSVPKESTQPLATSEPVATATAEAPTAAPAAAPAASATSEAAAAPAKPAEPAEPEPAADIVTVPMKVTFDPKTVVEIKDDKSLTLRNKRIGAFEKNTLKLDDCTADLRVAKDGTIYSPPSGNPNEVKRDLKLNDKDEILVAGGKVSVDDKGKITVIGPNGKPTKPPPIVVTGFKPEARRALLLLTLLSLSGRPDDLPSACKDAALTKK
jgi:hypothetical protein